MKENIRVKACLKCKKYVPIHEGNFKSNEIVKEFEKEHAGHMIITSPIVELNGDEYKIAVKK